jgi:hypothetical protein
MQSFRMFAGRESEALLTANVIGAALYVFAASWGGWAIPGEPVTGEPFVWFLAIFPVVAVFFVANLIWTIFLVRHRWKGVRFWLLAGVVWLAAIAIDFAHH